MDRRYAMGLPNLFIVVDYYTSLRSLSVFETNT